MRESDYVKREKLEHAFEQIRRDVAYLHKDLAYAAADRVRWLFLVMWVVSAHLAKDFLGLNVLISIALSGLIVYGYRFIDRLRIKRRALRLMREPLEPMFETKVNLS